MSTKDKYSSDKILCPVCNKEFDKEIIEIHVNKCIFLHSLTLDKLSKRNGSDFEEIGSQQKRIKMDVSPVSRTSLEQAELSKTSSKGLLMESPKSAVTQETSKQSSSTTLNNACKNIPLAEEMRPMLLEDIIGQVESFGAESMLYAMLLKKKIPNMILWGPPGCGKTSVANIIANICKDENSMRFVKLSATMCGINDVKEVVKVAKNEIKFKRQTVLFMDEIHRFNKLQQDSFLPHVENGTITLVGATTENPSFSLNNALLSRCRVVVLSKLTVHDVLLILERAVVRKELAVVVDRITDKLSLEEEHKCIIERQSLQWLAEVCDGDARVALGALELALGSASGLGCHVIGLEHLKKGIKRSHMLYDRQGEEHYNIASAIQKSIRASDDNAALYWTTRALHGGEDPLFIARRLVRTAAEDIGLGDPNALVEAVACMQGCQQIGMPECDVLLAQCAVRLARADKSTEVYRAMKSVQNSLRQAKGPLPPVPLHLRNAPTKLMKDLGYGKGYNTRHRDASGLTYMPEGLEHVNFFDEENGG
ncbi:ATPase WRNIP1-like [Pararge aegeria]|uniref:Jg7163 protein n=2 Tax=Pararge aegeria TaxID=116150 RepID=A0A8S4RAQ4_9NEOP|nr:ATPase WRNIP1-like [Pararge aegeria]CAH2231750.1 jg7163 [Pararge aegeria aegeria]